MTMRFSSIFTSAFAAILLLSAVVMAGQSSSSCTLCADGATDYNTEKLIPWFNMTCRSLEFIAVSVGDTYMEACSVAREHASWCECPGAVPSCPTIACPVGSEPANPNLTITGLDITCADLNYLAHTVNPSTSCESFSTFLDMCGGCDSAAPTSTPANMSGPTVCASLCPGGEPVASSFVNNIIFDHQETASCGQLEDLLRFVTPFESCDIVHYIGVTQCGCNDTLPPIPQDADCYVCEDGSVPMNLSFNIHTDLTCRGLGYVVASDNETCSVVQATAGAYCGCDNPKAEENVCRLCGGDSLLPDPSRVIKLMTDDVPCIDLEFQANEERINCTDVQNVWAPVCCSTETPTLTPSVAPSSAPSPSPSESPSAIPSESPSMLPLIVPSMMPSMLPSMGASEMPSLLPSIPSSLSPPTAAKTSSTEGDSTSSALQVSIYSAAAFVAGASAFLV